MITNFGTKIQMITNQYEYTNLCVLSLRVDSYIRTKFVII